jgi:hypothetical protein
LVFNVGPPSTPTRREQLPKKKSSSTTSCGYPCGYQVFDLVSTRPGGPKSVTALYERRARYVVEVLLTVGQDRLHAFFRPHRSLNRHSRRRRRYSRSLLATSSAHDQLRMADTSLGSWHGGCGTPPSCSLLDGRRGCSRSFSDYPETRLARTSRCVMRLA